MAVSDGTLPTYSLTYFIPLVSFYTSWEHQKTSGFLMVSGGIEKEQWHKISIFLSYWLTDWLTDWLNFYQTDWFLYEHWLKGLKKMWNRVKSMSELSRPYFKISPHHHSYQLHGIFLQYHFNLWLTPWRKLIKLAKCHLNFLRGFILWFVDE